MTRTFSGVEIPGEPSTEAQSSLFMRGISPGDVGAGAGRRRGEEGEPRGEEAVAGAPPARLSLHGKPVGKDEGKGDQFGHPEKFDTSGGSACRGTC